MRTARYAPVIALATALSGAIGCFQMEDPTGIPASALVEGGTPGGREVRPIVTQPADSEIILISDQTLDASGVIAIESVRYPRPAEPWGKWVLDGGSMLSTFVQGLATFSTTTDVTALELNDDGTGRVYFRDRLTDAKDCSRVYAVHDGESLVLDFAAELTSDVTFNLAIEDYTYVFPMIDVELDSMFLATEDGQVALFSKVAELPEDVACGELEVVETFAGLPAPQFFGDLVFFNEKLVYNSNAGQFETFDTSTRTLGAPLGPTSSRLVQTVEGDTFWTHCGCGGSRDAFQRTLSTVLDTVSSEDEMGGPITFRAMAYDPVDDRLWLHGRPFDNQFGQFFIVNTNSEPDKIQDTLPFNRDLRALATDEVHMWGIITVASQQVVRIDMTTGKVVATYEIPDENVSFNGLTFDDNHEMYLLGTTLGGEGVIYHIMTPE